jgi:hypothetical protein
VGSRESRVVFEGREQMGMKEGAYQQTVKEDHQSEFEERSSLHSAVDSLGS